MRVRTSVRILEYRGLALHRDGLQFREAPLRTMLRRRFATRRAPAHANHMGVRLMRSPGPSVAMRQFQVVVMSSSIWVSSSASLREIGIGLLLHLGLILGSTKVEYRHPPLHVAGADVETLRLPLGSARKIMAT